MVPQETVIAAFITDSIRLSGQARTRLAELEEQARYGRMSPGVVRTVYQIVHTLKGTSAMVSGAEAIVETLHQIEAKLACRNLKESASDPTWLAEARAALERTHEILENLKRARKLAALAPAREPLVKGMLALAWIEGQERLVWFPVSCVGRVLAAEELGGATVCVHGEWVSVLGRAPEGEAPLGLAIRAQAGAAVFLIRRVVGICAWSDAQKQGAAVGLDLLSSVQAA